MNDAKDGEEPRPRLVGFIGTADYAETTYALNDETSTHSLMPVALAQLLGCTSADILGTEAAFDRHGAELANAFETLGVDYQPHQIATGRDERELRDQFRTLRDVLMADSQRPLVIDITLGFRAQPFFAAAGIATLLAAGRLPSNTRLFYGAFEHREDNTAPVWELTPFLDMIAFAQAAATFRSAGDGRPLVKVMEGERRRLAKRANQGQRHGFANPEVIASLKAFSTDLAACRVASLLVGTVDRDGRHRPASASRLHAAINRLRNDCNQDFPALVPMLDDLAEITGALLVPDEAACCQGMAAPEARRAAAALAKFYMNAGRLMEAAAVAREEIVSRMADTPAACKAARPDFSREAREAAEKRAGEARHMRGLFGFRNDLLHAGMRERPIPGERLANNVSRLVTVARELEPRLGDGSHPPTRTILVTRHRGAVEWLERQGITADKVVTHLDETELAEFRTGDRVIGTLPPQLLAALCDRGVRCDILVIDASEEQRGQELGADELEAAGARLMRAFLTLEDPGE